MDGVPEGAIELLDSSTRDSVHELIKARGLVDVLIPRGGPGLISFVADNATVPVIETGAGNCHIFVDESADFEMADDIVINAKTQRPSVCNAAEKLLVHQRIAAEYIPRIVKKLLDGGVEVRGDDETRRLAAGMSVRAAEAQDWDEEYLRLCIAIRVVPSIEEAIAHINRYSTKNSEAIVTSDEAQRSPVSAPGGFGGGVLERLDPLLRWRRVRLRRGDGNQHPKIALPRTLRPGGIDLGQVRSDRQRTGSDRRNLSVPDFAPWSTSSARSTDEVTTLLQAGDMAPDFDLPVLDRRREKTVPPVRAPRQSATWCSLFTRRTGTRSARSRWSTYQVEREKFLARQAEVLGISVDSIMNTTSWEREIGPFDFLLGSDFWPHGEVSRRYGVLREADPFKGASERAIFVIDKAGKIRFSRIYPVDQLPDLEETLEALRELAKNLKSERAQFRFRSPMKFISAVVLPSVFFSILFLGRCKWNLASRLPAKDAIAAPLFGFRNSADEIALESRFLAVPDPKLAEEHLRILTQAPHMAGTPEDKATADYVAQKFRDAGLETEIVEYRVWMNYPAEISVDMTAPAGVTMHGPTRERVNGDPYQDDPRVVMPFNSMSPSGDVEAEVVYANYGSPDDFQKLEQMKIDVRGKIVLVRYGQNFRGVKAFVAQEHGAAGVLIYSDPGRRRLAARRQISAGPVASRHRRAARLRRLHVPVSRRSHHARESPRCHRCRIPNARLPSSRRSCRKFPRRRFPTPTPGRSSSIWADPTRLAIGKARCLSPTTLGRGRQK